jgi:hypothetical protein
LHARPENSPFELADSRMHHAHVKFKEQPMNPITLERYLNEPELDLRLAAAARRARAESMARLLKSLVELLAPRPGPACWLARLG